jgi:hypothetical protein
MNVGDLVVIAYKKDFEVGDVVTIGDRFHCIVSIDEGSIKVVKLPWWNQILCEINYLFERLGKGIE